MNPNHHPWPTRQPDADTMRKFMASRGLWVNSVAFGTMDGTDEGREASSRLIAPLQHTHDVYVLLSELQALDPARADDAAARIWLAAEAGDTYGEMLWAWTDQLGLHADDISENGHAHGADQALARRTRATSTSNTTPEPAP